MRLEFVCVFMIILFGLAKFGKAEIYIVTVEGEPVVSYRGGVDGFEATAVESDDDDHKLDSTSEVVVSYARHLEKRHDLLLGLLFEHGTYEKLYSYRHLINGFAVHLSPEQAETLRNAPGVKSVERDWKVKRLTTHTPQFLGLPTGVWPTGGGYERAGEDIVIGFVDSGIYPHHPSFTTYNTEPYGPVSRYRGKCEVDPGTKRSFCNGKIIGAQHFAQAAIAAGAFNPSIDFDSPLDGDGHGSHTASIAAGRNGIPVRMYGHEFGKASGMAPRARIAVYKALYRLFGGFIADVVAAIDQAVHDGVDILSLSVGPNSPPSNTKTTFLNPFDATLLGAVKAGVFVAQAAGNGGPFPKSLVSYSPWIATVAAAIDDRRYKNHLILGNGKILAGIGLSRSDLLSMCNNGESPIDRFISVVAWTISTTRPVTFGVAPYNPILGETHHVSKGNLNVLLEQISHHPPVAALHATDEKENIEMIWCQRPDPKFNGTSVEAKVHGIRQLKLLNHGETYETNCPHLLLRIFPVTSADWSGTVTIRCQETGIVAELSYRSHSSFLGIGGNHRVIKGKILDSSLKVLYEVDGHWDRVVKLKDTNNKEVRVIYDAKEVLSGLETPKLKDSESVWPTESAHVWGELSEAILRKDWEKAREAKLEIEERQRKILKERESKGETWVSKHFVVSNNKEGWECSPIQNTVPAAPITAQ